MREIDKAATCSLESAILKGLVLTCETCYYAMFMVRHSQTESDSGLLQNTALLQYRHDD